MKRLRQWWRRLFHEHHHAMTFPNPDALSWLFVCECGHTTTDIREARP